MTNTNQPKPLRLAVLLSGSGTTLQNLLDLIAAKKLSAQIKLVVSSQPDAFGLTRAKNAGIATAAVRRKDFKETAAFAQEIFKHVDRASVDLVVCAGFMAKLVIPQAWTGKVINVHPALIPAFCGKGMYGHHVHEAAVAYGVKVSGCTVHFVDNEYDHGAVIAQGAVPVFFADTPDDLAGRVQAEERRLYPRVIQAMAEGRVVLEGRRVRIEGEL